MVGFDRARPQDLTGSGGGQMDEMVSKLVPTFPMKNSGFHARTLTTLPKMPTSLHRRMFVNWDGVEWKQAPREFGLDLNRNFPSHWAPFSMFGMDGGAYSLSEPESRALIDAFLRVRSLRQR